MVLSTPMEQRQVQNGVEVDLSVRDFKVPEGLSGKARELQIKTQELRVRAKALAVSGVVDTAMENLSTPKIERLTEVRSVSQRDSSRMYTIYVRKPE